MRQWGGGGRWAENKRAVLHFDLPVSMAQLPLASQALPLAAGTHQSSGLGAGVLRDRSIVRACVCVRARD